MPHAEPTRTVEGEISDVFAHRFVLRTADGPVLADLGPKGAKKAGIRAGDKVRLTGRSTPSELKVVTFERGGETIEIEEADAHGKDHGHKGGHGHAPANPAAALAAVAALGHAVMGEPRRKPKHFEVLAKDSTGAHYEHHVALDGTVKKTKRGDPADGKWTAHAPTSDAA